MYFLIYCGWWTLCGWWWWCVCVSGGVCLWLVVCVCVAGGGVCVYVCVAGGVCVCDWWCVYVWLVVCVAGGVCVCVAGGGGGGGGGGVCGWWWWWWCVCGWWWWWCVRGDNGSNFRGAEREIMEMIKRWRDKQDEYEKIEHFVREKEIKWTFSTPLASHHNGLVESMVKSVKTALRKLTNDRILTEEEYRTILMEVQNLINSCPLWPPTDRDLDEPAITCSDLLCPKGLNRHPHHLNEGKPGSRYLYIQRLVDEWWCIWLRNFVPNLQVGSKWWKTKENLAVGDIILLIDFNISRGKWQIGKVIEVFPGKDGKVRSAKIKTSSGIYDRPVTKMSLLLSKEEYETDK